MIPSPTVKKRTTLVSIAKELDLSTATVSSVINRKVVERGIKESTAQRVRDHLRKRGFLPSYHAQRLRARDTDLTGILHCGDLRGHQAEAFRLLVDGQDHGPWPVELRIVPPDRLAEGVRDLLSRGVTRLVWISRRLPEEDLQPDVLALLEQVTVVMYNYLFSETDTGDDLVDVGMHLVGVDRARGFRQLAAKLMTLGHRRACLPDQGEQSALRRPAGRALYEAGFERVAGCEPEDEDRTQENDGDVGAVLADRVVEAMQKDRVTATVFTSDENAGFALPHLRARGVRVPDDLSVTGFEGLPLAAAFAPPLTTLRVPVGRMTRRVDEILKGLATERRHCFPLELVERESLGPAPHA